MIATGSLTWYAFHVKWNNEGRVVEHLILKSIPAFLANHLMVPRERDHGSYATIEHTTGILRRFFVTSASVCCSAVHSISAQ